jgi:hypothetical protein
MPAGRGKQCEACYWQGLLEKRLEMNCVALGASVMSEHFREFGQWLGKKVGNQKAAITLNRYLAFFMQIDQQWKSIPDFETLLKHFGTLKLRRVLLPMLWMQEANLVVPNKLAKEEDSDQRRILATLDKLGRGTPECKFLEGYYKQLQADLADKKTTIRSIRLAMSPAASLLLMGREIKLTPPNQAVLKAYLGKTPGQRAAISGFVCYLRKDQKVKIELPAVDKTHSLKIKKRKLEAEVLALMQSPSSSPKFQQRWLSVGLAYFHGLPKSVGRNIHSEQVVMHEDGSFTIPWNEREYWVPGCAT